MNSIPHHLGCSLSFFSSITSIIIAMAILHLVTLYPFGATYSSLPPDLPASTSSRDGKLQGTLLDAEKMRLGSRPPICHNKCNQCHPCMAVQVPTMPSQSGRIQPSQGKSRAAAAAAVSTQFWLSDSAGNDRYSNYKPLGWKCRCRDRVYDP